MLSTALSGKLFREDCSVYSPILYIKKTSIASIFIFSQEPSYPLPEDVFLMPDGGVNENASFRYHLGRTVSPYCPPDSMHIYYLMTGTMDTPANARENFRVYVSFQLDAWFGDSREEIPITVKDIGAGGFFFIASKQFKPGLGLSAIFTPAKKPILVSAEIRSIRPAREKGFYGYGCQFVNLTPAAESAVRSFVFKQEVLQAKRKAI